MHTISANQYIYQQLISLTVLCLLVLSVTANDRQYVAPIDKSAWDVSPHHPLLCKMTQMIPFYGIATFMQEAGKRPAFKLDVLRGPEQMGEGILISTPPIWLQGARDKELARIEVHKGRSPFRLPAQQTRLVLAELETGWFPTFIHQDWEGTPDIVSAKLSSVNFRGSFADYLQCLQQLFTYGYDDIKFSTIYYRSGGASLNDNEIALLDRIVKYIEVDPSIRMVLLKGYSDSAGTRRNNYLLSIKRLRAIEDWLKARGIDEKKIDSTAFGERNPIASNSTAKGRAKNRRVTIHLQK